MGSEAALIDSSGPDVRLVIGPAVQCAPQDRCTDVVVGDPRRGLLRLRTQEARLFEVFRRPRTLDEVAGIYGVRATDADFDGARAVIDRFVGAGILVDAATAVREEETDIAHRSGLQWDGPVVRWRLFDPQPLLDRMRPTLDAGRRIRWRWVTGAAACITALSLLVGARHDVTPPAATPATVATLWIVLAASTLVHELAHAATLAAHGGRVREIGVMLFYGTPAAYCDVSEAWLQPRRTVRAAVAAAGIVSQLLLAALAAFGGMVCAIAGFAGLAGACLAAAILLVIAAVFNAIPLVRLDGYWVLVALLDRPRLRHDALTALRRAIRRRRADPWWLVALGLGSSLFPLLLFAEALSLYVRLVSGVDGRTVVLIGAAVGVLAVRRIVAAPTDP